MKRLVIIFISFTFVALKIIGQFETQYDEVEQQNARQLALVLCLPTNTTSQIWTTALFNQEDEQEITPFIVKCGNRNSGQDHEYVTRFEVFTMSKQRQAVGKLIECPSFDSAKHSLMLQLVACSLPMEAIITSFALRSNGIGDFSIVSLVKGSIPDEAIDNSSELYFVRGAKAICLRSVDETDLSQIARALDGPMTNAPAVTP